MSVSLNAAIDYNQWQKLNTGTTRTNTSSAYYTTSTGSDYYVSSSGETCTDGKDDGKIGFFSKIGNAIKGVGKTIVNGVKSCFTNSEGKFSLGKTLLTAATAAACIAFPAVGVAACAIGAVSGAVTVGKGIYNAATATTDAEAKEAWQNIGGGTFTAAVSVVGAKSGMKAVKNTSTAGINGGSALDSLDDTATIGQKISAFAKDCKSSTVNRASSIKNSVTSSVKAAKIKSLQKKSAKGTISQAEEAELSAREASATDAIKSKLNSINNASEKASTTINNVKNAVKNPKNTASNVKNTAIKAGSNVKNTVSNTIQSIKNKNISVKSIGNKLSSKGKEVLNAINSTDSSYAELVNKYGYENVAEVLKVVGGITFDESAN